MTQEKLVKKLRELKEEYGITYIFFAKAMGITKQSLWKLMQDSNTKDYRKMTEKQIEKIEKLCNKLELMMEDWKSEYENK